MRPATAVAISQVSNCAPEGPGHGRPTARRRSLGVRRRRRRTGPDAATTTSRGRPAHLGRVGPSTATGSTPLPSLPVDSAMSCSAQSAKPTMPEPRSAIGDLVAARVAGHGGGEHERGVVRRVGVQLAGDRLRLVEQLGDVDAGQAGRHQPERGQRAVAAADVRVGEEDLAVALARVASFSRSEPGSVTTTIREAASMPGRLERLRRGRRRWLSVSSVPPDLLDTTTTVVEQVAADRAPDHARVGRVEDRQRHAVACARSPRVPATSRPCRTARPGRGPRTTAAPAARRSRRAAAATTSGRPTQRQPDRGLGLGVRTPERGVLGGQLLATLVGDQSGATLVVATPTCVTTSGALTSRPRSRRAPLCTVSSSSCQDFSNFSTPSSSTTLTTSS